MEQVLELGEEGEPIAGVAASMADEEAGEAAAEEEE